MARISKQYKKIEALTKSKRKGNVNISFYAEQYRTAKKEAKLDTEYAKYVKKYYGRKKHYRKTSFVETIDLGKTRKIKIKPTSTILTSEEFKRHIAKGMSVESLITKQFGLINDKKAVKHIVSLLEKNSIEINFERAQARQLTDYEWQILGQEYHLLGEQGYEEYYFGSL